MESRLVADPVGRDYGSPTGIYTKSVHSQADREDKWDSRTILELYFDKTLTPLRNGRLRF